MKIDSQKQPETNASDGRILSDSNRSNESDSLRDLNRDFFRVVVVLVRVLELATVLMR